MRESGHCDIDNGDDRIVNLSKSLIDLSFNSSFSTNLENNR